MSVPLALIYLADTLDDLSHMPFAEEAWDELDHASTMLERMVDRRAAATFAGTCDVCGHDLYAAPGEESVTCSPCSATFSLADKRAAMLDALDDRLVRASEAVHVLPGLGTVVSRKDIDRWVATARLLPHGRDERGRPLYLVRDLRELAANTRRRTRPA